MTVEDTVDRARVAIELFFKEEIALRRCVPSRVVRSVS